MAAYQRLGRAPVSGAYPRWGYLDKFLINERMARSLLLASVVFLGIMAGWQGWVKFQEWRRGQVARQARGHRKIKVLTAADIGVPPSLTQQKTTSVKVDVKTRPKIAMPKPVPDDQAVEETVATSEDMAAFNQNVDDDGSAAGDSIVVNAGDFGLPSYDEYVAFEKAPELVSMEPPVYPDLANDAGVEGTVMCRVLVGEDGFVKDMVIIQSIQMLDEAAADAAWTAVFKPALQKDRPVAVWMVIPIEFTLHS